MNRYLLGSALAAMALATVPVSASTDLNGAPEIQRGDYPAGERIIRRELQMWPGDADLLLNLATILRRTNRTAEARDAYARVLAHPDDALETGDSVTRSSHAIARAALATLDAPALTAR